jgi:hypothetical protein
LGWARWRCGRRQIVCAAWGACLEWAMVRRERSAAVLFGCQELELRSCKFGPRVERSPPGVGRKFDSDGAIWLRGSVAPPFGTVLIWEVLDESGVAGAYGSGFREELDGGAVAVEGADVHVGLAGGDAEGGAALGDVGVDEGAEVFVLFVTLEPELVEVVKDLAGHAEGAPDPVGSGVALFDLDLLDAAGGIGDDGVEVFGFFDGEKEEGEGVGREGAEAVLRKPDGVGQADGDLFAGMNDGDGAEDGVAKAGGTRLDDIGEFGVAIGAAVVFEDVGFSRGDDEADFGGASDEETFDEVFTDSARTFGVAIEAAADGEEFFGEGERLDAAACACCWNDAPHSGLVISD